MNLDKIEFWLSEISAYDETAKQWLLRCEKILKRYRDEKNNPELVRNAGGYKYNLYWSNCQMLMPMLYSQTPKYQIEQRYKNGDDLGLFTAQMHEAACTYNIGEQPFDVTMIQTVNDYMHCARGTGWVRYEPAFGDKVVGKDDKGEDVPEKVSETAFYDFVHYQDYLHSPNRYDSECWWKGRKTYWCKDDAVKKWGKKAESLTYDFTPESYKKGDKAQAELDEVSQAIVYEIWCKRDKKIRWFGKDAKDFLDVKDDFLHLKQFFPCPRPMFGTITNEQMIPVPDYTEGQDLYIQLDEISNRISNLEIACRVTGVRDASIEELTRLLTEGKENELIPVSNWIGLQQGGGLAKAIELLPLKDIVSTLEVLYASRERIIAALDQQTGTADIARGQSDPRETLGAQQIKMGNMNSRLGERQREIQRFVRDVYALLGEIIADHFDPQSILDMSGTQVTPDNQQMVTAAINLLKNDMQRRFRIDIETDSTVAANQQQDQQNRTQFLQATSQFLQQFIAASQQAPAFLPALSEMFLFGIRGFRAGRAVEMSLEKCIQNFMQQQQQQPQPGQGQDQAAQQQAQTQAQAAQADAQVKQQQVQMQGQKMQQDAQVAGQMAQMSAQKQQADTMIKAKQADSAAQLAEQKMMIDAQQKEADRQLLQQKTEAELAVRQQEHSDQMRLEAAKLLQSQKQAADKMTMDAARNESKAGE